MFKISPVNGANPTYSKARVQPWLTAIHQMFFCAILFGSPPAIAVYPFTDAEYAMLPEYCRHQGFVSKNHRAQPPGAWKDYFGTDFDHIHHWCAVYMWMGRTHKAGISSLERRGFLGEAEGDINYFVRNMRPDSPIAGEVYTRLGEIYLLQGKPAQAEPAFKRAHEIDPSRWQAYFFWAYYLYKSGRSADARKEVLAGLEHSPENKALKSLLADLGSSKSRGQK